MLASAVSVLTPQIQTEYTFSATQFASGGQWPWTHVWADIQAIVAAVLWNNCPCLCPAVSQFTLNTQGQNVHFNISMVVVVACSPLLQKAKQKYVLVVMDRICYSAEWCCCHVLFSNTITTQTQGTFVNHEGEPTNWTVLGQKTIILFQCSFQRRAHRQPSIVVS